MKTARFFALSTITVVAMLLCIETASAQAWSISFGSSYGGTEYRYAITEEVLADTPSWDAAAGDPPVSIARALEIARTNLQRFVAKGGIFGVNSIELNQVGANKWFYVVQFQCWRDECRDKNGDSLDIVVKMDGTVLEPKLSPSNKEPASSTNAPAAKIPAERDGRNWSSFAVLSPSIVKPIACSYNPF